MSKTRRRGRVVYTIFLILYMILMNKIQTNTACCQSGCQDHGERYDNAADDPFLFLHVFTPVMDNTILWFSDPLCQFGNGHAGISFAKHTQAESTNGRMGLQMVLYLSAQHTCSLSVNDSDLVQTLHHSRVDRSVDI